MGGAVGFEIFILKSVFFSVFLCFCDFVFLCFCVFVFLRFYVFTFLCSRVLCLQAFRVCRECGVNVQMISQGASKVREKE